jgi:hypothetical protein
VREERIVTRPGGSVLAESPANENGCSSLGLLASVRGSRACAVDKPCAEGKQRSRGLTLLRMHSQRGLLVGRQLRRELMETVFQFFLDVLVIRQPCELIVP